MDIACTYGCTFWDSSWYNSRSVLSWTFEVVTQLKTFQHGGFSKALGNPVLPGSCALYGHCWPRYWVRRKIGFGRLFHWECVMHCGIDKMPDCIKPYFTFRDELAVVNGLILKGDRILIPKSLCEQCLKHLHKSHMGITKNFSSCLVLVYFGLIWVKISLTFFLLAAFVLNIRTSSRKNHTRC